jgi:choline dehydrogenase-like flavoprotein
VVIVIGSGPAGVACARALLARGADVNLLDAGIELEPERRALVDELAGQRPQEWPETLLAEARRQPPVSLGGVPLKYAFGSAFPYRDVERLLPFQNLGSATRPTLARGGFSTVWGSAVLPYLDEDLADWPIGARDLAPHYRAVTGFMPLAGVSDDLAAELPLHDEDPQPLAPSAQARALLADLERRREKLRSTGLRFGRSRLAVRAEANARGPGCAYCQMCMHGCPYALIYDAAATLAELRASGLRYTPGFVADRLVEGPQGVEVLGRSLDSGERMRFEAERVYVACGAVATTRLLLASLEAFDRPVRMLDSQYFLLPLLRFRGVPSPRGEQLHTMAQLFLELRHASVGPRNVHLQVYGYSDLFAALFDRLLGPLARPLSPAVDALLARMLVIQGYLHSEQSPSIRVRLMREGEIGRLVLEAEPNPVTRPTLRRVVRYLLRHAGDLRALALAPALQVSPAGRGFHSGGSFPMRASPGAFESDLLGRPRGFQRVHAVDATVFPTIPSTTITFSVMANAHRIGSEPL